MPIFRWHKVIWQYRSFWKSELGFKKIKNSLYIIDMNKDRKIDGLITIEELPKIHEFAKATYLISSKPEKSVELIKNLVTKLKSEYFGLPVYTHLLMFYSEALK